MSRRVFVHIGLPKTGTTYLQTVMWDQREAMREAGMLLPGRERRDHLWASLVVRGDPHVARRNPRAPSSWDVLRAEVAEWPHDAVISHEFFCSATAEQAREMVEALAPAEVHVVVTAREPLSLFTSSWQESLKNKSTERIEDYARTVSEDPLTVWDWRALDLRLVLERWGDVVPSERVHVLTMPPPGAARSTLWDRFAGVLGLDPAGYEVETGFANSSMGVVEAETLRRINEHLDGFSRAHDRGVWIRSFLADERLVPRGGDRFWPGPDQQEECRERARAAVELVRERGFHVVGELDSLLVPDELPPRRHPSSVTDAEVAQVAVELSARLLADVRERSRAPGADPAPVPAHDPAHQPEPDPLSHPAHDPAAAGWRGRASSHAVRLGGALRRLRRR